MSDETPKRNPVPEDSVERFMVIILSMTEAFGIDEIPEVNRYVTLLDEAVQRHLWEQSHTVSPQKRVHQDRKRFIAIFKQRYLEMMDLEYPKDITGVEGKGINQAIKLLKEKNFEVDDYLQWLFDIFFKDEGKRFCPPVIKQVCSNYMLHQFIFNNKEMSEEKKRGKIQELDRKDLSNRVRFLMRSKKISDEDKEKLKASAKQFTAGDIIINDIRKIVEGLEKKYGG